MQDQRNVTRAPTPPSPERPRAFAKSLDAAERAAIAADTTAGDGFDEWVESGPSAEYTFLYSA